MERSRFLLIVAATLLVGVVAVQVWASWTVMNALKAASAEADQRLANLDSGKLSQAKTEEEIRALRIENERKVLFTTTFLANLNAAIAMVVAFSGAAIAFHQYLNLRRKERLDRAGQELAEIWKGIGDYQGPVRAASVAALQHFLESEKSEYHAQVVAALALVGRASENEQIVRTTFTRVVEAAMRKIPNQVLRSVSWQGLTLFKANLSNIDLHGLDLRDCRIQACEFNKSNLSGVRFDAAGLKWCSFVHSNLSSAAMPYADLANASLQHANLTNADLRNIKILGTNFEQAELSGALFDSASTDWTLAADWRKAKLDPDLRDRLLRRYGPELTGIRILMIMWEHPPFVSGGGWTALYHLLKSLRPTGANVTLLIPWSGKEITHTALGFDYPVLACGIEAVPGAPYTSQYSQYNESTAPLESRSRFVELAQQRYGSFAELIAEFETRATRLIEDTKCEFDVIHASDWSTFRAASRLSALMNKPWIAHFHSTELERRTERPDRRIMEVEREACRSAAAVVSVGTKTKEGICSEYGKDTSVTVIPNSFWSDRTALHSGGTYDAARIAFVGRMAWQKGPDHFVKIAAELRKLLPEAKFVMYGSGEQAREVAALINRLSPPQRQSWEPDRHHNGVSRISPVMVDPTSGEWNDYVYLESEQQTHIFTFLGLAECQCTVEPVQMTPYFTHLATVDSSKDKTLVGQQYLISSVIHLDYASLRDPFVVMAGELSWEQRKMAYNGASAVVVPSRSEPFGMVVLEAMEAGVPVFYTAAAGVADVIRTGMPLDPSDHKRSAALLHRVIADPLAWQKMVDEQIAEITSYDERGYHEVTRNLWHTVARVDEASSKDSQAL